MTTSQEGASGTTEAPPPPPPPPIETSFDLWDPFGNPAELRAAADAWDAMGAHLSEMRSNLNGVVTASAGGWSGGAHDAFVAHWNAMAPELGEGGEGMREVASHLRTMADELEAKNDLVQSIYVTVAATAAVSIISGLVTFGVGAAAGAAATAVNVARAERALVAIRAFIVASRATMATIKATRVGAFALRFAAFAARGVIETAAVKQVALDQNPLDADSWSAFDVLFIGGGGLISAAPARMGAHTGRRLAAREPPPRLPRELAGGNADTYVYQGIRGGKPVYSGITKNPTRRAGQHAADSRNFSHLEPVTRNGPVTRGEARAIEQTLIKRNRLENKINSISPKHPYQKDAVKWGEDWLRRNGL